MSDSYSIILTPSRIFIYLTDSKLQILTDKSLVFIELYRDNVLFTGLIEVKGIKQSKPIWTGTLLI